MAFPLNHLLCSLPRPHVPSYTRTYRFSYILQEEHFTLSREQYYYISLHHCFPTTPLMRYTPQDTVADTLAVLCLWIHGHLYLSLVTGCHWS